MATPLGSILHKAARHRDNPLNILCCPTHEAFEQNLAKTNHDFYAYRCDTVKDWNSNYRRLPDNYTLLAPGQIPADVEFDLVLVQNIFGQHQVLAPIAARLHLPLLRIEHTCPHLSWTPGKLAQLKALPAHRTAFISHFSRKAWGYDENEATVVKHGIDTEVFCPANRPAQKKKEILTVVNDFFTPEREWCCGYPFYEQATHGLPRHHVGSDPQGRSKPASCVAALVDFYRTCGIFVDTASSSPLPTVLLEAMACGAIVVSRGNAMVPEVIEDGVNGFIRQSPEEMRKLLQQILRDGPEKYADMGREARRTILERFSLGRFVADWDVVLRETAEMIPYGDGEFVRGRTKSS